MGNIAALVAEIERRKRNRLVLKGLAAIWATFFILVGTGVMLTGAGVA